MAGISKGVGISPVDGINSGAAGINSGLGGLAGGAGTSTPPVTPTYYQRLIPGYLSLQSTSVSQAVVPGYAFVDGR